MQCSKNDEKRHMLTSNPGVLIGDAMVLLPKQWLRWLANPGMAIA
jgi:hypothetical protein